MLNHFSIRNIVLIDQLDLDLGNGLCALTGETGAGKSIVLDSLGLALGDKANISLLRAGEKQASVMAEFHISDNHAIHALLEENGLNEEGGALRLKRMMTADGKSKAFINDQSVGLALLKQISVSLMEIHGQFDTHGLMDPAQHISLLDEFGDLLGDVKKIGALFQEWRNLQTQLDQATKDIARAREEEDYLRHAVKELELLNPQDNEEDGLLEKRQNLSHRDKVLDALQSGDGFLSKVNDALRNARKNLERVADKAGDALLPILEKLDSAEDLTHAAVQELQTMGDALIGDAQSLETVEDRLYELRAVARKHGCAVTNLPSMREQLVTRLNSIDHGKDIIAKLTQGIATAEKDYETAARALHDQRARHAVNLSKDIMKEFKPLKLDKARFMIDVTEQGKELWSARGMDKVAFMIATNEGSAPAPLHKIASGGELARFMLALKVVLSQKNSDQVLIFDEVDSGIGGAVADAVGDRLKRLADNYQVLVITHSPQVAAKAAHHYRVEKVSKNKMTMTSVRVLNKDERLEEIARMLSGAEVTVEARAAAKKLLAA